MTSDRSIRNCPECHHADDVRPPTRNDDGDLEFRCDGRHGGIGPVVFVHSEPPPAAVPARTGPAARPRGARVTDDLLDPFLNCISPADGWVEYGVLEHRLRMVAPDVFARHIGEADHVMFGAGKTASRNRFVRALQRLAADGRLRVEMRRSTGEAWKHDTTISFWRMVPTGPSESSAESAATLTWVEYCRQTGRSDNWTPADRDGLTRPIQADPTVEPA